MSDTELRSLIHARRQTLEEQVAQAQQQYAQIETLLHELDRQICGMHGGLQELSALIAESEAAAPTVEPAERSSNGVHA
jgi:phage shock protein A